MSSIFAASRVHLIKVLNRSHPPPCTRAAVASLTPAATQSAQMTGLLKSNPRIILGSSSRTRRLLMDELAAEHGFTYEVLTADIDEKSIRLPDPRELVLRLAHAKADAIAAKLAGTQQPGQAPAGLLVTCDQVVVHEGRILEKPEDAGEAREFIAGYGRSPASTVGSVVCTDLASGRRVEGVDSTQVRWSTSATGAAGWECIRHL